MTELQRDYFDDLVHRFPEKALLHPSLPQQLELQALQRNLDLPRGSHLIDFGSGSGRVSLFFLQQGYDVLAVDISAKSLTALTGIYHHHRQTSWGRLTTATGLPRPSPADGIVGADILHHIDLPSMLPTLLSVLKPGGHVAFSEPNAWHLPWYLYFAARHIPWEVERNIRFSSLPNLSRVFRSAGFTAVEIEGHGFLPTPVLTGFPMLCALNVSAGNLPGLKSAAFRFILSARK